MSFSETSAVMDYVMDYRGQPNEAERKTTPYIFADVTGIACFRPVSQGGRSQIDWDLVHQAVQRTLGSLTDQVLESCPGTSWKPGCARARAFRLFSYRVFNRQDLSDDSDPVIVGLTFSEHGQRIQIKGDISGEESGEVYFDQGCEQEVVADQEKLIEEASRMARGLASQWPIIIAAIQEDRAAT